MRRHRATRRVITLLAAAVLAAAALVIGSVPAGSAQAIPRHALIGYLHASFANGSGYLRMADVPGSWDIINLAFGEPTSATSGDIRFARCPASECPNVETEAEFTAGIRAKQDQGKKVLISIGGQNGQVQLTTTAARDAFVRSVSAIIDRYGLDGLDIDFEGHSLYFNPGDTDFRNPTTPVIVSLISALKSLRARYGPDFVLTMAPETFFVQVGHQFYGGAGGGDNRTGSYLPVIHAMRDALTVLHVQDYNSGPVMGLDGQWHHIGNADFHIAMTDMVKAGFRVANTGHTFPGLRDDQIGFGLPAATSAGNGYTPPAQVHQALNCLVKGQQCGGYALRGGTSPALRGLMTWSINWDRYFGWEFMNSHRPFLDRLSGPGPTPTATPTPTPTASPTPTSTPTEEPPGDAWAAGTAYQAGDVVTHGGTRYRCRQAHTALPGWEPPNTPALWEPV